MLSLGPLLLAVSVTFHGVIGQSAPPGAEPLRFTGVLSLCEGPDGRLFFIGDDSALYEIRDGEVVPTHLQTQGVVLRWDGRRLLSLGHSAAWEVDLATQKLRPLIAKCHHRLDVAAVVPAAEKHPFARFGSFVTYDQERKSLVGLDEKGDETGPVFPLPKRRNDAPIVGLGFLPGCEDLVCVSYYPDLRTYRFRADGAQVTECGWPMNAGFGTLVRSGGALYRAGTSALVRLEDNLAKARDNVIRIGCESQLRGFARQGERAYVATSQGLYVQAKGETDFRRRLGGIRPLTALTVHRRRICFSMGGAVRWMWLDEDETGAFGSSDDLAFRVNRTWTNPPVDLAGADEGLLVAAGKYGKWRLDGAAWTRLSELPCERVAASVPADVMREVRAAEVPGGIEPGKMALEGKWLVVEDRRNFRLVRFLVKGRKR